MSYLYIKQYSISLHTYTFQKHCIQLGKWWIFPNPQKNKSCKHRNHPQSQKNNSKFTVSLPWSYRNTLPIRSRELGFESRPESRGQFKKKTITQSGLTIQSNHQQANVFPDGFSTFWLVINLQVPFFEALKRPRPRSRRLVLFVPPKRISCRPGSASSFPWYLPWSRKELKIGAFLGC